MVVGGGGKKEEKEKEREEKLGESTYASIKKAAQPPCKLPSGLSMSKNGFQKFDGFKKTDRQTDRDRPSVTVSPHTTLASVLVGSSALGTTDASIMVTRSPIDAPYTFGRPMISCMTLASICLVMGGRLPLMRLSTAASREEGINGRAMVLKNVLKWCWW